MKQRFSRLAMLQEPVFGRRFDDTRPSSDIDVRAAGERDIQMFNGYK